VKNSSSLPKSDTGSFKRIKKTVSRFFLRFHPWQILLLTIPFSFFFMRFFDHPQLGIMCGALFAFSFLTIYMEVKRFEAERKDEEERSFYIDVDE
jgi:hypothetical protein